MLRVGDKNVSTLIFKKKKKKKDLTIFSASDGIVEYSDYHQIVLKLNYNPSSFC